MFLSRLMIPAAAVLVVTLFGAQLVSADTVHRHRHWVRSHRTLDVVRAGTFAAPGPYGDYRSQVGGAPPDNTFDPTRPYGGQSAITAPPGTAAFDEQANERRYFCEYAPEHC